MTMTVKISKQSFSIPQYQMLLHHYTNFGYNRLSRSDSSITYLTLLWEV